MTDNILRTPAESASEYQPEHAFPEDASEFEDMIRDAFLAGADWRIRNYHGMVSTSDIDDYIRRLVLEHDPESPIRSTVLLDEVKSACGSKGIDEIYALHDSGSLVLTRIGDALFNVTWDDTI
jgi:hypothetical protein